MQGRKESGEKLLNNRYTRQETIESQNSCKFTTEENNNDVYIKETLNNREKVLLPITLILFIIVIVLVVIQVFYIKNTTTYIDNEVCTTRQCVEISASIMKNMDVTADPCNDFYRYSCGGWVKRSMEENENRVHWDVFSELTAKRNLLLRKAFYRSENKNNVTVLAKLFRFYKSCSNSRSRDKKKYDPIINIKKLINTELGGSPLTLKSWSKRSVSFIDMLIRVEDINPRNLYLTKVAPFLDTIVRSNIYNSSQHILMVKPPELGMYDISQYNDSTSNHKSTAYRKAMTESANILLNNKNLSKTYMDEVFKLEQKIALILPPISQNEAKTTKKLTIEDLTELTERKFDWLTYFNKKVKNANVVLKKTDSVLVQSLSFIKAMVNIMNTTEERVVANYMTWTVIQNMYDALPQEFENIFKETGMLIEKPRWEKCIAQTESYMGMALGYLYIKEKGDLKMREEVEDILVDIKKSFIENLKELTWMDTETKKKAEDKANKMKGNIAFPAYLMNTDILDGLYKNVEITGDYLDNMVKLNRNNQEENVKKLKKPVRREEWLIAPTQVNAFYDAARNKMVLLAGVLQPPFYTANGPKFLNFGALGFVMGHELTHGFDNQGRLYDGNGDLNNWWSKKSEATFIKKSKCFINQYSNYSVLDTYVNGKATLQENLADNGGVPTAYHAYQSWLAKYKTDILLPGLDLTNKQLFFVAASQMWCSMPTVPTNQNRYPPTMFRVRGSLSNSKDFAKAYQCQKGSTMNPVKKCKIW